MKEIPILFSTAMVQAILEGRKSQTRRLVKWPKVPTWHDEDYAPNTVERRGDGPWWPSFNHRCGAKDISGPLKCPYGNPGNILWVRETWGVGCRPDPFQGSVDGIEYKADAKFIDDVESLPLHQYEDFDYGNYDKSGWYPSIHMPKAISRIWLQVESVRVERLQDISEEDAKAEGVERLKGAQWKDEATGVFRDYTHRDAFELLWEEINGADSWDANPCVWVVSFKILSTTGKPQSLTEAK